MTNLFSRIRTFLPAFALALTALGAAAGTGAATDPRWTIHSTAYNQPRRIAESADRVYFLMHPGLYDRTKFNHYYNDVAGAIFYIDKDNIDAGFKDFAHLVDLSGFDIRIFEVDPESGLVALAYTDGLIDIVTPAGDVISVDALQRARNFRRATVNTLYFDPETGLLNVSTDGGFAIINPATGEVVTDADWHESVQDIVRSGNRYFALIGNRLYTADADANIFHRESFTLLPNVPVNNILRLLPFAEDCVAYVANNGYMYYSAILNDKWFGSILAVSGDIINANATRVASAIEHTIHRIPDGYLLASSSKAYYVTRPEGERYPRLRNIDLPGGKLNTISSYDGTHIWLAGVKHTSGNSTFTLATLDDEGAVVSTTPEMMISAPHAAKDLRFAYSPEHGMIAVPITPGIRASFTDSQMPFMAASYNGESWTDLSPINNDLKFMEGNTSFINFLNSHPFYPIAAPNSFLIDPLHPDMLMVSSLWNGIAAIDMRDPTLKPHCHMVPNTPYNLYNVQKTFPGSSWSGLSGLYLMGDDADGNIWATRSNLYPLDDSSQELVQLWYLTPEARKNAFENGDTETPVEWKKIELDGGVFTELYCQGKALKHPKNRNKFLWNGQATNSDGRMMRIYDHKGTLDDNSDDTLTDINFFRRDDGSLGSTNYINDYFEDPVTGDIFVFASTDLFVIDLDSPVTNRTMAARALSLTTEEGNRFTPFIPEKAYLACQDEYGRIWFASDKFGVYGISADRTRLVAHFTAENSPLPSNCVLGLGWNPASKSLFISTPLAVAEVKVDASEIVKDSDIATVSPVVEPAAVTPDFTGTVAIHNVPANMSLRVRDGEGRTVALLTTATDGVAFWDLRDLDGNPVRSGRYSIVDAGGDPDFETILLPVVR